MSDILKVPPIYDVVEVDGGAFLGGNVILQKELPGRVANITIHNQTTTNHTKYSLKFIAELICLLVSGMTKSLMYYKKYNFTKKLRQDMCCILRVGVIFRLDLPTGKLPI